MKNVSKRSVQVLTREAYFEDPTLPLQIYIRDPQPPFPLHRHGFDELVVVLRGTATHLLDGQAFTVKRGDVFVIRGAHEHEYQDMHGLALANILFDSQGLRMDQWNIRALPGFHALFALEPVFRVQHKFESRLQLSDAQLEQVNEMIYSLTREIAEQRPGYRVMAKGYFMHLAVYLSRAYSDQPTQASTDLLRIGDAIAYIETHYQEKISLDELARKSCLSKRHFSRIFHGSIGRSPMEHLMQVRIWKAAELLKLTRHNVTDIAFECGFSDSNYFSRCFRRITGESPLGYRRSARFVSGKIA